MSRLVDDLHALRDKLCGSGLPRHYSVEDVIACMARHCPELGSSVYQIKRIESLDEENIFSLRDLESGMYILYGYFKPFPNSDSTLIVDDGFYMVARVDEGSHLLSISPLNFKMTCHEILVDETNEKGFTYTNTRINLLDVAALLQG